MVSKFKRNRTLIFVAITILSLLMFVVGNYPILAYITN